MKKQKSLEKNKEKIKEEAVERLNSVREIRVRKENELPGVHREEKERKVPKGMEKFEKEWEKEEARHAKEMEKLKKEFEEPKMNETKQEKGTNKKVIIFVGIVLLAVIAMFALKSSGVDETAPTDNTGNGVEVSDSSGEADTAKEPETKTEPETIESEIKMPSLLGKTLGPGETVEAFEKAIREERYDDAMGYISSSHRMGAWLSSKWDLREYWPTSKEVIIINIEYLDADKTMVEVKYETEYLTQDGIDWETSYLVLGKEDNTWKIVDVGRA